MKKYKIARYAYKNHVDYISVPDETVFYETERWEHYNEFPEFGGVSTCPAKYVAVIDYTEKTWKGIHKRNQSLNADFFNAGNKKIIITIKDAYPLSEDFPLSKDPSVITLDEPIYIRVRAIRQINKYTQMSISELQEEMNKLGLNSPIDLVMPVIRYIKINGFYPNNKNLLNVTQVVVGNYVDDRKMNRVEEDRDDVKVFLTSDRHQAIESSTKEEFEEMFNNIVEKMR